jgi:Putative collagen-binding domain of a collagenase
MGLLRRLFTGCAFQTLRPAPALILDGPRQGGAKIRAACAEDGSFVFIYSPRGEAFTVDRRQIKATRLKEIWFDPRYGSEHHIHTTDNGAIQTYTPPTSGRGNDWLLILEGEAQPI